MSFIASQRTPPRRKETIYQPQWNVGSECSKDCGRRKVKRAIEQKVPHRTEGNVLDDLGFSPCEALELKVKSEIHYELVEYIKEQGLTQQQLGAVLGIHQPDVSYLLNGRVSKFSVGKLIKFAGKLNLGAQVKITKPVTGDLRKIAASAKPRSRVSLTA
jgi:predicted XRE-type DNA-binding protein